MSRFGKFFLLLFAGALIVGMAGLVTDYWLQHIYYAGPVVLIAAILGAGAVKQKHRKICGAVTLWAGLASLFFYSIINQPRDQLYPEQWGVIVTCFTAGLLLGLLIYYIKVAIGSARPYHRYVTAAQE